MKSNPMLNPPSHIVKHLSWNFVEQAFVASLRPLLIL